MDGYVKRRSGINRGWIRDYFLNCGYYADDQDNPINPWDFNTGKSAGVCVEDGQFYVADTSNLQQPFSDAFVTFYIRLFAKIYIPNF